ncbi:hypothetical protein MBLNU459_g0057t1 [Dothideomycetes sp. NU459]
MPSDDAATTGPASPLPKRPPLLQRHSSTSSHVSQSPADSQGHRAAHHKPLKHVVGHGRMGRNPSFHRSLSKLKIPAANAQHHHNSQQPEDDGPPTPRAKQHARTQSIGSATPLTPVSPRPNMKRTNTSLALPRTNSHSALKKNHSSGQLQRLGSSKHIAHLKPAQRPAAQRANTQPPKKHARSSPPADQQHASVRFDMGDTEDDDGGEMEGVDDQWTEESASASPNTTRDNTRSNTRQNSVILDPAANPYARAPSQPAEEPTSDEGDDDEEPPSPRTLQPSRTQSIVAESEPPDEPPKPSSYHDQEDTQRTLDADAIARRLLQRSHSNHVAPPRVSSISALANAGASDSKASPQLHNGAFTTASNTPVVSRFIGDDGGVGSKDATPQQSGFIRGHHRTSSHTHAHSEQSDLPRNKSAPNFSQSKSPPGSSGPGSGAVTPDPGLNNSRTQQKLWLQRGLSKIEASSQPHLPGLLPTGRAQAMRTPGAGKNLEFVDKEYAVVRRFVDPLSIGLERVKKMNGGALPGKPKKQQPAANNGQAKRPSTSTSAGSRKSSVSQAAQGGKDAASSRSRVSFHTGEPDDDNQEEHDEVEERGQQRETAAELARRLWEQPITITSEA